ncbi:hypothetical protein [Maribacter sp.]|uniref:hypothetical protein n=1 Tax=Maribacter sp. TaxID=1897614 RepID=UPI0025C0EAB9|nr:hypothetical protein [Maribacter sp.]
MGVLENVKDFFKKKLNKEETASAPEGICPNCWGRQEWEGNFYTKIVAKNITPQDATYSSFIHEVVSKLDKITLKEDMLTCETCAI